MQILAEQPLITSLALAALGFGCLYGWLQTGKRAAAMLGIVFLLCIPPAIWLAHYWQTDREQVIQMINQTAAALSDNDVTRAISVIDPAIPGLRAQAENELARYEFKWVSIGQFRSIVFVDAADPPEALVDVTANALLASRAHGFGETRISRRVIFRCRKYRERWFVSEYTHLPVIGGPDGYTPQGELLQRFRER